MNQWTEALRHGRRVTIRPIRVDDGFAVRPNSDDVRQFICSLDLQRVLLPTILTCMLPAAALGAEADGAKLYQNHCSACHGMRAEGDGPIAMLMTVTVPNLRELAKHNDGVFPTDRVAAYIDGRGPAQAHGGRQMPVWGDVFSAATKGDEPVVAANVKVLVQFIEELQQR
jgi:mono/diheme cytochrome c family protein